MTQTVATDAADIAPGTLLGDRFEITTPVGSGAMGFVYRANDLSTQEPAAVKVLHRHLLTSREYVSRFRREAQAAARFRHPSAVKVLATGQTDDKLPYIAMELLEGPSLKELMEKEGTLRVGRSCNLAHQILRALGAAHQHGIVHRDMKPDNIRIVVDEDGIERPKILDFGVAKFIAGDPGELEGAVKTRTGVVLGTPKYMAPEQIRGAAIDGRADIYAVGATLHEMLTGVPPFEADDVFGFVAMHLKERVVPITERFPESGVPPELDEIVMEMLEKDPKDRPADAATLADRLEKWAVADPRAAQKGRAAWVAAAVVVVAGGVAAAAAHFGLPHVLDQPEGGVGVDVAAGAAGVGLGLGAALSSRLVPRPSVYGYARRILIVAGALLVMGGASALFASGPGQLIVTAAHGLAALLCYAFYLVVWAWPHRWLRPIAAGIVAPAVAGLLMPVRVVAPAGIDPYFLATLATRYPQLEALERSAHVANLGAVALVAVLFALASIALPKPSAARL